MAFLGQDGWKSGLSAQALSKIEELEAKTARLEKDRAQKQMRAESMEQQMEKHKAKMDEEKNRAGELNREMTALRESCLELQKIKDKLQHDLGSKDKQNDCLQVINQ